MGFEKRVVERLLQRALDEFDSNPMALQFIRRLSIEASELFFDTALPHLKGHHQSNAHRMLAILMMKRDSLVDEIVSPVNGGREDAIRLFRRFAAVDPSFDVKLARRLPGRSYIGEEALDGPSAARALDVLDETSRGRRLLPIVGHLPNCGDSKLSAKATLFVGKRVQNPVWTAKQLKRPDQRVRASAVESLWGLDVPAALKLLDDCSVDRNNRVAGNALIGLHIAGRPDAANEILAMSRVGADGRRLTAAWALGQMTGDVYLERLTEMVRDENPQVRGMALRSLLALRKPRTVEIGGVSEVSASKAAESVESASEVLSVKSGEPAFVPSFSGATYTVRRG